MAKGWIVLAVGIVAVGAVGVYYTRLKSVPPEPGRGTPWTVLQDVEAEHRGDAAHDGPLLLRNVEDSRYSVLGLPTGDPQFPRAWILLNEHTGDGSYKMVPANARFHVDCTYVDTLLTSTPVEPAVEALLKRRCSG